MLKKIFILFRIARRLAISDAVEIVSRIHQPPLFIKILLNIGDISSGRLLIFDALKMSFRQLAIKKRSDYKIESLIDYQQFCGVKNMEKSFRGQKHVCSNCNTKFFDFNKEKIICPNCKTEKRIQKKVPISSVDFKTEKEVETVDNNLELSKEVEFDDN